MGMEKSRSISSGGRGGGSADWPEDNHVTATKISSTSVSIVAMALQVAWETGEFQVQKILNSLVVSVREMVYRE